MGVLTLSNIVATASALPATLALFTYRKHHPLLTYTLAHAATAGFVVAIAASPPLAAHTTWLLGKMSDGTISWWGLALFWPYHVALRTKLSIQRHITSEPAWNQVAPKWYLGSWVGARQPLPSDAGAILDLTCELPLRPKHRVVYQYNNAARCWDTQAPSVSQIEEGVRWALQQKAAGRGVYVHCAHGHGRSNVMLCAILVAEGTAANFTDAHNIVRRARPKAKLNTRQRQALVDWTAWRAAHGKEM